MGNWPWIAVMIIVAVIIVGKFSGKLSEDWWK